MVNVIHGGDSAVKISLQTRELRLVCWILSAKSACLESENLIIINDPMNICDFLNMQLFSLVHINCVSHIVLLHLFYSVLIMKNKFFVRIDIIFYRIQFFTVKKNLVLVYCLFQ